MELNVFELKVVFTENALKFVQKEEIEQVKSMYAVDIYTEEDEWNSWKKKGDPVLHIELRKWASIFLIAPISANTLAKLANGLSDNLLVFAYFNKFLLVLDLYI